MNYTHVSYPPKFIVAQWKQEFQNKVLPCFTQRKPWEKLTLKKSVTHTVSYCHFIIMRTYVTILVTEFICVHACEIIKMLTNLITKCRFDIKMWQKIPNTAITGLANPQKEAY